MSDDSLITVKNLTREFRIAQGKRGFLGSIQNLFSWEGTIKTAVSDISFSINAGEFVGYVGENGAGKSTTIKMLTGILTPTSGSVTVAGITPYEERAKNAKNIGVVFGQRTQLWWDLPVVESFDLLKSIFRVPEERFKKNFDELSETLDLKPLLGVPVRKLSLGQKMRCDIAASLLHSPKILFLDEPTIGLDIIAKEQVRKFLKKINKERGTTIILTTHDMDDIETLCNRIVIIDEGKIVYDGATAKLKRDYIRDKALEIELYSGDLSEIAIPNVRVVKSEANKRWLKFCTDDVSVQEVISKIMNGYKVKDISIHEPKVEDVVKTIYRNGTKSEPAVP